jgi:hypothetical protein
MLWRADIAAAGGLNNALASRAGGSPSANGGAPTTDADADPALSPSCSGSVSDPRRAEELELEDE